MQKSSILVAVQEACTTLGVDSNAQEVKNYIHLHYPSLKPSQRTIWNYLGKIRKQKKKPETNNFDSFVAAVLNIKTLCDKHGKDNIRKILEVLP